MMLNPIALRSMRLELTKLATEGMGPQPQQYEELTKKRLIQAAKDIPIAILGTGLGYGVGRTLAEHGLPKVFSTPASQEQLMKHLPLASAVTGGLGSYFLAQQARLMKQRRDEADRKPEPGVVAPMDPAQKTGGGITPAVAQATWKDPWRTDRRYPQFNG